MEIVDIHSLKNSKAGEQCMTRISNNTTLKFQFVYKTMPKKKKQINSDVFVGVSPRKTLVRFYLSWINNMSTRSGILQFLVLKDEN